ncbi:FAD-dependent oxidoreductase [Paenibacillus sp. J2TS4]|uniref:FAD-dependent oxidoreductase n=1 Tax=Paenibacillus sp. J2TS4 TaxID=2807194 RepID=UPI001B195EAD|nr:FAD-dependent oxidoreductase [Paenibacillus sp. J2TS4]GIP32447.1 FAD-dependent oxidoreductase [Paenibacillus sp. J2TS4]
MIREMKSDVVIIGGSLGGCAAALAIARLGKRVILTEETDWIGGQLTSQAVPPDEHRWIEQFGCTRSYRQFRNGVRQYYRDHYPLTPEARSNLLLNPGNGGVSRLCHEPRVALAVLQQMMAPYVHSGRITIWTRHQMEATQTEQDNIVSVTVKNMVSGHRIELVAPYVLDATECGDLLPLARVEYVTGAESQSETGEPSAVAGEAQPMNMQGFTYCFAMDYIEGGHYTIDKPEQYDFWRGYAPAFWPGPLLNWTAPEPRNLEPREYTLLPGTDKYSLFYYRSLIDRSQFAPGTYPGDISLVNWPQNDYFLGPIIDVSEEERNRHLKAAKQLSLSLLYWLQTEAPRQGGGYGHPELRLRPDVVGTEDGLAMYPYIRESRRISAEFTVLEQHISAACRSDGRAEAYRDSVGIGCYRIDLHPTTAGNNFLDISSLPYQIPLGSLIPVRVNNLLPACKNLGVTHLSNSCYRVHPTEWNIGESAGSLAAFCLEKGVKPRDVLRNEALLDDFQKLLVSEGVELSWAAVHAV